MFSQIQIFNDDKLIVKQKPNFPLERISHNIFSEDKG